jgi:PBP1b-binding outer membrane lipoprotein LpoB|tara:strand:+ start:52 stop:390 length:339 start_codon:yes stop_codon:yes gene_type:complete
MKRFLGILILGLFLSSCADYIAEKERLKLQKENAVLEKKRQEDKATCKYYGFKVDTPAFSDCLMNLDIARKQELITRKMLECEAVRRDNNQSAATGFWAGVLMGARENLACD